MRLYMPIPGKSRSIQHRLRGPAIARVSGFTLVELMFTLILAGILIGLAVPSFREYRQNSRAANQSNQLVTDLYMARMEAIKFGYPVRVTATGGNWTQGWTVASDRDRNGAVNGPDVVMRQTEAAEVGFTWTGTNSLNAPITSVFFNSNGYLIQTAQPLMFQLKTPDGVPTKCRRVAVSLSGRAEARKGTNNPCT